MRNLLGEVAREHDEALVQIERLETALQSKRAQCEAAEQVAAASEVVAATRPDTIQQLRQQIEGMTSFPDLPFFLCIAHIFLS